MKSSQREASYLGPDISTEEGRGLLDDLYNAASCFAVRESPDQLRSQSNSAKAGDMIILSALYHMFRQGTNPGYPSIAQLPTSRSWSDGAMQHAVSLLMTLKSGVDRPAGPLPSVDVCSLFEYFMGRLLGQKPNVYSAQTMVVYTENGLPKVIRKQGFGARSRDVVPSGLTIEDIVIDGLKIPPGIVVAMGRRADSLVIDLEDHATQIGPMRPTNLICQSSASNIGLVRLPPLKEIREIAADYANRKG